MSHHPIAEYALISDCHSAALVHRSGSVDWLCFPRFDAASVFARLLDERAGYWSVSVASATAIRRRYLDGTLVLETEFETTSGRLTLTDALALGPNERGHEMGARSPHALLRRAECTAGTIELALQYEPRLEYGLIQPGLRQVSGGLLATGDGAVLLLSSAVPLELADGSARARIRLRAGESRAFALQYRPGEADACWTVQEIEDRLAETVSAWRSWSEMHQRYDGPWRELVHLSGRVLRGLPTSRPGPSLPRQRHRYPRSWAASATGTIATPGSAIPRVGADWSKSRPRRSSPRRRRGEDCQDRNPACHARS